MTENQIYKVMKPVKGEMRAVYKCSECGQLFGHRFIPYGLGHGLKVNECACQLTGLRAKLISERRP